MQQDENFEFIQYGNNSYIHRLRNSQVSLYNSNFFQQVIKSVLHCQCKLEQKTNEIHIQHQQECSDLMNEWRILSSIDHPNIIKTYSFNQNQNISFREQQFKCCQLRMEGALTDSLNAFQNNNNPCQLELNQILKAMFQIGKAIEFLHKQGITHNDIKLENILIFSRNTAKLADFGFSRNGLTSKQDFVRSWQKRHLNIYSSPEIIRFRNQIHEANETSNFMKQSLNFNKISLFDEQLSDIYALTTSLFIAFYKRSPIYNAYPTQSDPLYSMLLQRPDDFWDIEALTRIDKKYQYEQQISIDQLESFKNLIESGLDEQNRININQWINHDFWENFAQNQQEK